MAIVEAPQQIQNPDRPESTDLSVDPTASLPADAHIASLQQEASASMPIEDQELMSRGDEVQIFNPEALGLPDAPEPPAAALAPGVEEFNQLLLDRIALTQEALPEGDQAAIERRTQQYAESTERLGQELARLQRDDPQAYLDALKLISDLGLPLHDDEGRAFKGNMRLVQELLDVIAQNSGATDPDIQQAQLSVLRSFAGQLYIAEDAATAAQTRDQSFIDALELLMSGEELSVQQVQSLFGLLHRQIDITLDHRQSNSLAAVGYRTELELDLPALSYTGGAGYSYVSEAGAIFFRNPTSVEESRSSGINLSQVASSSLLELEDPTSFLYRPKTLEQILQESAAYREAEERGSQDEQPADSIYFADTPDDLVRRELNLVSQQALRSVGDIQVELLDPDSEVPGLRELRYAEQRLSRSVASRDELNSLPRRDSSETSLT